MGSKTPAKDWNKTMAGTQPGTWGAWSGGYSQGYEKYAYGGDSPGEGWSQVGTQVRSGRVLSGVDIDKHGNEVDAYRDVTDARPVWGYRAPSSAGAPAAVSQPAALPSQPAPASAPEPEAPKPSGPFDSGYRDPYYPERGGESESLMERVTDSVGKNVPTFGSFKEAGEASAETTPSGQRVAMTAMHGARRHREEMLEAVKNRRTGVSQPQPS